MSSTNISRLEASERSAVVQAQNYDVELDLSTRDDTFGSRTTVHFTAREGNSTWIDFIAPKVQRIELNGESLDTSIHDGFRIPLRNLKSHNVLIVEAEAAYMNTGEGMHRFIDPVDDEVYLYTQFEIADARRVFACFDQPDIKATFTFSVTAPDHWKVVSNSTTPTPSSVRDGIAKWEFPATKTVQLQASNVRRSRPKDKWDQTKNLQSFLFQSCIQIRPASAPRGNRCQDGVIQVNQRE